MSPARLIETAGNPAPPGATLHDLVASDGIALRAASWAGEGTSGTVLICTGRTEFIEKYFELAAEFLQRGYAVVCFDWRGQGLSQRLLPDRTKGHVGRFADFDLDMDAVLSGPMAALPRPWTLCAHSMGGHLALRHLARRPADFERAILVSPMLKIAQPWALRPLSGVLAATMCAAGRGDDFTPGKSGDETEPFDGNTVTSDHARFTRNNDTISAEPQLALGRPTWRWLNEAFASIRVLNRPSFAARIKCPLMIFGARHDKIVSQGADADLIGRLPHGRHVLFSDAEHEIVQERDDIRRVMWGAMDGFLTDSSA